MLDVFALTVVTMFVLWGLLADTFQVALMFGYIGHLALPVAFIWLPLAIVRRRWLSIGLQATCVFVFIWLFRSDLVRSDPAPPPADASTVTVMTYNLGNGLAAPAQLLPVLRASGADVIGLQEVSPDIEAALAASLSDRYPYRAVYGLGIPGTGLLSRYPIRHHELLELNPGRPDLRAVVEVNGVPVTVLVAHPPPPRVQWDGLQPRPGTADQVEALLDLIEQTDGPLLVLGDFNVTQLHDAYRQLEEADLDDAYRVAGDGWGFTTPTRLAKLANAGSRLGDIPLPPVLRIDYIWSSRHWHPVDAWIGADAGSDHLPVVARLAIQP